MPDARLNGQECPATIMSIMQRLFAKKDGSEPVAYSEIL